jgi:asparagine synthase (glutamine-hydrolysing)
VQSFSIGIKGAPDLVNARKVAAFLGTEHHEFTFTPQEALDALPDVIWHLETFEQVRASVPMYLLSRKIKGMGVKMVLSGEGADEAFGGACASSSERSSKQSSSEREHSLTLC